MLQSPPIVRDLGGGRLERREALACAAELGLRLRQGDPLGVCGFGRRPRVVCGCPLARERIEAVRGALRAEVDRGTACRQVECHRRLATRVIDLRLMGRDEALRLVEQRARPLAQRVELVLRGLAALAQLPRVLLVAPRSEERPQQRLAFGARGEQEAREPVLGEQDDLLELLGVETEHVVQQQTDVARLARPSDPGAVDELLELGPRGLGGESPATEGGPEVLRCAGDAPAAIADRELQAHLGRVSGLAVVAAQPLVARLVAGHAAVQREADAVEDARLAGAGTS